MCLEDNDHSIYILDSKKLCTFDSFLAEMECTVHVAMSKWPIYQFKPVQQSRKKMLRNYYLDIYTVIMTKHRLSILSKNPKKKICKKPPNAIYVSKSF